MKNKRKHLIWCLNFYSTYKELKHGEGTEGGEEISEFLLYL